MKLDREELIEIAHMVADIVAPKISKEVDEQVLWRVTDIEKSCGYGKKSSAILKWINDASFPRPVVRQGSRRWLRTEVIDWIKKQRELEDRKEFATYLGR